MITETKIQGAYIIHPRRFDDERGFFAQSWSIKDLPGDEFGRLVESNLSFSRFKGTLRGLHYQRPPHAQAKMVRCTRGAVYDVIVDLRRDSPSFKHWFAVELSAENRITICVPRGVAHGLQTLVDNSEIFYLVSDHYAPDSEAGIRWNDPAFEIKWPALEKQVINQRDRSFPDFKV